MKKHIKGLIAYGLLIIGVCLYVVLKVGLTFNLTQIMPKYDTIIYSKANMYNYDLNLVKSASNQLDKQIDKVRNDIYSEKDYYKKGLREILFLNKKNYNEYIASFSEIDKKKYNELKNVENIDYIKNSKFNYKDNLRQNDLNLYIYPLTAIDKGLYYEIDCDFYKPIPINKNDISKLKVGDIYDFHFNVSTTSDILKLTYQGNKKFKYDYDINVINQETNNIENRTLTEELSLKDLNNDEYAIYDANNQRFETIDSSGKVYILKDAQYGSVSGSNFLFLSNYILLAEEKNINYNSVMRFSDFIEGVLKETATKSNATINNQEDKDMERIFSSIYLNHIVYDKKGYITDLYTFTGA